MTQRMCTALCVIALVSLSGCPAGSGAVGAWTLSLNIDCAGSPSATGLILYENGGAEWVPGIVAVGSWDLSGNELTIVIVNGAATVTFAGTLSGNSILDGTYTETGPNPQMHCFTAEKALF